MGRAFCEALNERCDESSMEHTVRNMLTSDDAVILIDEKAMVGGLVYGHYFDMNRRIASELFWWVDPEARGNGIGIRLLKALEDWARGRGAERLTMLYMKSLGQGLEKLYTRYGFIPHEASFVKVLT